MSILRFGILLGLGGRVACATYILPGMALYEVPVKRLIKSAEYQIVRTPKDEPLARYTLGRLHYLAYAWRTETLRDNDGGRFPRIVDGNGPVQMRGPQTMASAKRALRHLRAAVVQLEIAIRLTPENPLFHLTHGCVLEQGSIYAGKVKEGDTTAQWIDRAIDEYRVAQNLAWKLDSKRTERYFGDFGNGPFLSEESGTSYLRLIRQRGLRSTDQVSFAEVEARLQKLKDLPRHEVYTPIILSLTPQTSLDALLDPTTQTTFDLDGTGRPQLYPWLRPTTGLLVWDPKHTGTITSGRQLFGNVTWWMFWNTGYDALAALDDNHDGWLKGRELDGLAVWFDRNQNGRSDPGEVIPVDQLQIEAIHVQADSTDPLKSTQGLRLKNGTVLPTWDWIAIPQPTLLTKRTN